MPATPLDLVLPLPYPSPIPPDCAAAGKTGIYACFTAKPAPIKLGFSLVWIGKEQAIALGLRP
jgi:hypothetical protein